MWRAAFLILAAAVPAAAATYDVRQYGAAGDGIAKDTAAIQRAIDAAAQAGGGTVVVPAGTFKDCVKVKISYPPNLALSEASLWFAEKVGIVKSLYLYKNGVQEEFLLKAMK